MIGHVVVVLEVVVEELSGGGQAVAAETFTVVIASTLRPVVDPNLAARRVVMGGRWSISIWLFLPIGSPFCGSLHNKSPTFFKATYLGHHFLNSHLDPKTNCVASSVCLAST